jgi:hypothetical protein
MVSQKVGTPFDPAGERLVGVLLQIEHSNVWLTSLTACRSRQHAGRNSASVLRRTAIELAECASAIPPYELFRHTRCIID